ncbi:MAG: hypothetical protein ACYS22_06670, partial [Planctomycetota bacterium]
ESSFAAELPFAAARVASLLRRAASSALRGFASRYEDRPVHIEGSKDLAYLLPHGRVQALLRGIR